MGEIIQFPRKRNPSLLETYGGLEFDKNWRDLIARSTAEKKAQELQEAVDAGVIDSRVADRVRLAAEWHEMAGK